MISTTVITAAEDEMTSGISMEEESTGNNACTISNSYYIAIHNYTACIAILYIYTLSPYTIMTMHAYK